MRRTEFIDAMKDYAKKYGEVTITEVKKPNDNYTGITIKKPNSPVPVANIDMAYTRYCDGDWDIDRCYGYIDYAFKQGLDAPIDITQITDWSKAKTHLYIRLSGEKLDGPCRELEDMYMIPYLQMTDDGSATVRVTEQLCNCWEVNEDTLFNTAMRNQEIIRPVKITSLEEQLGLPMSVPVYIVSTKSGICGASAILYDGIIDTIREKIGEDYFIIPSSIHEVLVMPKSLNDNVEELVEMVTNVNGMSVDESDRLTNSVYTYDFNDREFRKVG